jgi:peroxiredoxin
LTKDSARVTSDALDALGCTEEAKALRERYGVMEPEKPKVLVTSIGSRTLLAKAKQQQRGFS